MLYSDVAMLYHYTTKNVNKAMKRNIDRFPEDFCFQLTEDEVENYGEEEHYHMYLQNRALQCFLDY